VLAPVLAGGSDATAIVAWGSTAPIVTCSTAAATPTAVHDVGFYSNSRGKYKLEASVSCMAHPRYMDVNWRVRLHVLGKSATLVRLAVSTRGINNAAPSASRAKHSALASSSYLCALGHDLSAAIGTISRSTRTSHRCWLLLPPSSIKDPALPLDIMSRAMEIATADVSWVLDLWPAITCC
jgi:hypothetical protein